MTPDHPRDWVDYLQALSTPAIAIAGAFIALTQLWIARQKYKHDLFDRRWTVYMATRVLISDVFAHLAATDEVKTQFLQGIRGAGWLFNQRIEDYLRKELWKQVCTLEAAVSVVNAGAQTPNYQGAVKAKHDAAKWIIDQDGIIDDMLGPFLTVDQPFADWLAFWKRPPVSQWLVSLCALLRPLSELLRSFWRKLTTNEAA